MSEEKKLAKRLSLFVQFDDNTIVAAVTKTTMEYGDLKAANEGLERLYNICKEVDETSAEVEHTKTFSPPH